jgi:heme-degrading monooxygenase HmoA
LKQRGDLTIWFSEDAINNWFEKEVVDKNRGRQRKYSDLAIKTIYILRQVFHLGLSAT